MMFSAMPRVSWYERLFVAILVSGVRHPRRVLLAIGLLILPLLAFGAGTTIPERYAGLCARLGRPASCDPLVTPAGTAWLTVVIADETAEPDATPVAQHAATIIVETRRGTFAQVFQLGEQVYGQCAFYPACVTQECVEQRPFVEGYTGPVEADLLDHATIANKAIWQAADGRLADRLRAAYGRTGLPIITSVSRVTVEDGSGSALPTVARMRARFAFAE